MNHFRNAAISGPPSGLVFAANSDNPLQVLHEAALGQREVCGLRHFLSEQKNVHRSRIWRIGRLADRLDAFAAIKSPGIRCQRSPFLCPSTKPALGQQYGTFQLENWLGHRQSLFKGSCADGLATGLSIQQQRRKPRHRSFHHFGIFSSLTALTVQFVLNDRQGLVPKCVVDQWFYSR